MKILIDLPTARDEHYSALHWQIAKTVGELSPFRLPVTIDRLDSASHPSNYQVVVADHISDGEGWTIFAVLTFNIRPGQFPNKPGLVDTGEPELDNERWDAAVCAWQDGIDLQTESEHNAIYRAMAEAGYSVRPHSNGYRFAGPPDVRVYQKHVTVSQSGGIDC